MLNANNYDFSTSVKIADYIKDCVDEYRKDPRARPDAISALSVIFNPESCYQIRILSGLKLSSVCERRIGVRRLPFLQELLNDIDRGRYDGIYY